MATTANTGIIYDTLNDTVSGAELVDNYTPRFDRYNHVRMWRRIATMAEDMIARYRELRETSEGEPLKDIITVIDEAKAKALKGYGTGADRFEGYEPWGAYVKGKCYACDYVERYVIYDKPEVIFGLEEAEEASFPCDSCPLDWPLSQGKKRCTNDGSPYKALRYAIETGNTELIETYCRQLSEWPVKATIQEKVDVEYYGDEYSDAARTVAPRIHEMTEFIHGKREDLEQLYYDQRPSIVYLHEVLEKYRYIFLDDQASEFAKRIAAATAIDPPSHVKGVGDTVNEIIAEIITIRDEFLPGIKEQIDALKAVQEEMDNQIKEYSEPITSILRRTDLTEAEEEELLAAQADMAAANTASVRVLRVISARYEDLEECYLQLDKLLEVAYKRRANLLEGFGRDNYTLVQEEKAAVDVVPARVTAAEALATQILSELKSYKTYYEDINDQKQEYEELQASVETLLGVLADTEMAIMPLKEKVGELYGELEKYIPGATEAEGAELKKAKGVNDSARDMIADIEGIIVTERERLAGVKGSYPELEDWIRRFDEVPLRDPETGDLLEQYNLEEATLLTVKLLERCEDYRERAKAMSTYMVTTLQELLDDYSQGTYDAITSAAIALVITDIEELRNEKVFQASVEMSSIRREYVTRNNDYTKVYDYLQEIINSDRVTETGKKYLQGAIGNLHKSRVALETAVAATSAAQSVYEKRRSDAVALLRRATVKQKYVNIGAATLDRGAVIFENYSKYTWGTIENLMQQLVFYGGDTWDTAIKVASNRRFASGEALITEFVTYVKQFPSNDTALKIMLAEGCDIDLDNTDTGSATGWDIGNAAKKTETTIVPDNVPVVAWIKPPRSQTQWNYMVINWPETSGTKQEFIVKGLYSSWLKNVLELIKTTYMWLEPPKEDFFVPGNVNRMIKIPEAVNLKFVSTGGVDTTYSVNKDRDNWELRDISLSVNMGIFSGISVTEQSGVTSGQRHMDILMAKEFTRILMLLNIFGYDDIPKWLAEGLTEMTVGGDPAWGSTILSKLKNPATLQRELLQDNSSVPAALGFLVLRYFAKQSARVADTKLTNERHRMSQLYPHEYNTMSVFPVYLYDMTGLTDASHMFDGCENMASIDTRNLDCSSVCDFTRMFFNCTKLTGTVGSLEYPIDCAMGATGGGSFTDMFVGTNVKNVYVKNLRIGYRNASIYSYFFGPRESYPDYFVYNNGNLVPKP